MREAIAMFEASVLGMIHDSAACRSLDRRGEHAAALSGTRGVVNCSRAARGLIAIPRARSLNDPCPHGTDRAGESDAAFCAAKLRTAFRHGRRSRIARAAAPARPSAELAEAARRQAGLGIKNRYGRATPRRVIACDSRRGQGP